jgi:hypothetical protein
MPFSEGFWFITGVHCKLSFEDIKPCSLFISPNYFLEKVNLSMLLYNKRN